MNFPRFSTNGNGNGSAARVPPGGSDRLDKTEGYKLTRRRHPEWTEHQKRWRFLADSLEGGDRYKNANYYTPADGPSYSGQGAAASYAFGLDPLTSEGRPFAYGQVVDRNLIPHLSETGPDGVDLYLQRLHRTPVPALVDRTIEAHLARVYAKEIKRDGPPLLMEWWQDVDGRGTPMDRWMQETVAPLLLVLGQLDLCFDHPQAPPGVVIRNRADEFEYGLNACVASIILPENVLWWRLDNRQAAYEELVVLERVGGDLFFRHWTANASNLYAADGELQPGQSRDHPYGAVPVERVFDRRKPRCEHTGKSRYGSIADLQRAIYNAESERILSGVQQSHAQLLMPEIYTQADNKIPIGGPGGVLPVPAKNPVGPDHGTWSYLDPPKGAQEALRQHILDFQDAADRDGALAKPAGIVGGTSTAQSGVSKIMDSIDGNALLAKVADSLGEAERKAAVMALRVLGNGEPRPADVDAIKVLYPKQFDLYTAADLASALDDIQRIAQTAGALPLLQGELIKRLIATLLPGIDDADLEALHQEVDDFLAAANQPEPPPETEPGLPPDVAASAPFIDLTTGQPAVPTTS